MSIGDSIVIGTKISQWLSLRSILSWVLNFPSCLSAKPLSRRSCFMVFLFLDFGNLNVLMFFLVFSFGVSPISVLLPPVELLIIRLYQLFDMFSARSASSPAVADLVLVVSFVV